MTDSVNTLSNGSTASVGRARELVEAMTPEERFGLVCGNHLGIRAIERLGLKAVHFIDASCGVRIVGEYAEEVCDKTLSHPCTLLLACTWNPDLMSRHACAIGEECRAHGIHVLLGPGINLSRNPVGSRNFEYAGEDPYLTSVFAEAFVEGLQQTGTGATIKHFIGNETEYLRRSSNSIIDERALHEVYLQPFRAGLRKKPFAVMTAYNLFENEWCSESHYVNQTLLRDQLGFDGLVMTDWSASWHGEQLAQSGCDLEMPRGLALVRDKQKLLGSPEIDRMATSIVQACLKFDFYQDEYERSDFFAHREAWELTARQVNDEGLVLLQNDGILPLKGNGGGFSRILVTGNAAHREVLSGGGSAFVKGYGQKTYIDALEEAFGGTGEGAASILLIEEPTVKDIQSVDIVIVLTGFSGEESNHYYEGEDRNRSYHLPEDDLIERCTRHSRQTVVVLAGVGGAVSMPWARDAAAILHAIYGGQFGQEALVDILTGKTNPSGKLAFTIGISEEDAPSYSDDKAIPRLYEQDPAFGQHILPAAHGSFAWSGGEDGQGEALIYDVFYKDSVFVGHRWYDWHQLPVSFPFGHGLSYTTFSYSGLQVESLETGADTARSEAEDAAPLVRVRLRVSNTGSLPGAETVQLYVSDQSNSLPRPLRELKAFKKVYLASGESVEVIFELDVSAFRYWCPLKRTWDCARGPHVIQVGASSRDILCKARIDELPLGR